MSAEGTDEKVEKRKKFKVIFTQLDEDDVVGHEEEDQKRRNLRRKQHHMQDQIVKDQGDLQDVQKDDFTELMDDLNYIHRNISHSREAQLDTKLLNMMAETLVNRAKKIDTSNLSFSSLAESVKKNYCDDDDGDENSSARSKHEAHTEISWMKLGADVGKLFLNPVDLSTMVGPMSKPKKVVAARQARQRDEPALVVRPEVLDTSKKDGTDEDKEVDEVTFRRLEDLDKEVKHRSEDRGVSDKFELLDILFDAKDCVQTVENFFDFAFWIKDGEVMESWDKKSSQPFAISADKNKMPTERRQHVLALSLKDMKALCKILEQEGTEKLSDLLNSTPTGFPENPLHRSDEVYKALTAYEQSAALSDPKKRKHDAVASSSSSSSQRRRKT